MFDNYIPKNELEKIILDNISNPNIAWDEVSINENITWEFRNIIRNNNYSLLNWKMIFTMMKIELIIFDKFKLHSIENVFQDLSNNSIFDLNIVFKYPEKDWDWKALSCHSDLDEKFLITFIEKDLNWKYIINNREYYLELNGYRLITDKLLLNNSELNWRWDLLSYNKNINFQTIYLLKDKNWDWKYITYNQKDIKNIEMFPDLPWEWYDISNIYKLRKILTKELINKFHMKDWNWSDLIVLKLIDDKFINDFPNKDYDWLRFTSKEITSISMLRKYSDKELNWFHFSISDLITMEDIDNNIDLPWDWGGISGNPNLTLEFIKKYHNKPWNYPMICGNLFKHNIDNIYSDSNKLNAEKNLNKFKEELIQKTWHPSRLLDWCFSIND